MANASRLAKTAYSALGFVLAVALSDAILRITSLLLSSLPAIGKEVRKLVLMVKKRIEIRINVKPGAFKDGANLVYARNQSVSGYEVLQ